jgi:hypothetical protein
LKEYFLALNNYNDYLLEYDTAITTPDFKNNEEQGLDKLNAILFLKQFN